MNDRKSFKLYFDRCNPIAGRLSNDRLGEWFRAVLEYVQTGALPETQDEGIGMAFDSVKPSLDYDTEKARKKQEQTSDAGKQSHKGKRSEDLPLREDDYISNEAIYSAYHEARKNSGIE